VARAGAFGATIPLLGSDSATIDPPKRRQQEFLPSQDQLHYNEGLPAKETSRCYTRRALLSCRPAVKTSESL
jgi:hypothetical protein